jgi:hypothetical protein
MCCSRSVPSFEPQRDSLSACFPRRTFSRISSRRSISRASSCHGWAARGDDTPTSDIDAVCFVRGAARHPKAYLWKGRLLDLWIHPVEDAEATGEFLKLHDGRTLLDTHGVGEGLLRRVAEQLASPRPRLDDVQDEHLRAWTWKMLDRAATPDIGGHHRRHWLLHDLPQMWCELRQRHFLGPPDDKDCVSDIVVQADRNKGKALAGPEGYAPVEVDLNLGCGKETDYVYAFFKKRGEALRGIAVLAGAERDLPSPKGYRRIDVDLNRGAHGNFIYICVK